MDQHRLPRHSSSHGTLRSSYSHGRAAHGPSPVRPLHKPLRSVNENSVLLPSPGALESMLKTTTETGDIGIFSIRPIPPSPQRRGTLSDISQQNPSPRPSIEELRHRNNGKNPSSFRDATSEIISMYGSESHKSGTSTLTPTSSEDIGIRSYSMTTCGSRHLSHHRSTATLQSQASGGPLQRPRSPFPYPTRLKRPGVRPASPALTESGRVDYSRMVEIDRTSYRTGHGPYKPSYPPMLRRPPPLGLRSDANQSTISLPSQGPPPSRHGLPGNSSLRTPSVSSMASWSAPYRERLDSPSSRTSSLTSIVNMYHRPPHAPRPGPSGLSAAVPRYYDYTEGFENRQPRVTTPVQPLAPVPTRASNCRRPLVLQESDDNLAIAFGERDSAFYEHEGRNPDGIDTVEAMNGTDTPRAESYQTTLDQAPSHCRTSSTRSENQPIAFDGPGVDRKFSIGSDIDLLPSQVGRDSMDTFNPSLDLETKDAPTYRYTDYRSTATSKTKANQLERHVQVQGGRTPTIRSEQGVILRDDTQDETVHKGDLHESHDADTLEEKIAISPKSSATEQRSCSEPIQDRSNDSVQPPNSQLRSVTINLAKSHHDKMDPPGDEAKALNTKDIGKPDYIIHGCDTPNMDVENQNNEYNVRGAPKIIRRPKFQRHRRNQAVPKISTSSLPREDNEGFQYISPSCSTTPIVSPKPISPARQLKLKNSIPQLMKALPPLPGDPDYVPSPVASLRSTWSNDDFPEVLSPFKFNQPSTPLLSKDIDIREFNVNPGCNQTLVPHKSVPKLRLKTRKSNGSGATASSDTRHFGISMGNSPTAAGAHQDSEIKGGDRSTRVRTRNRLKLRSSRSTTSSTPSATIRRVAGRGVSDFIVDIAQQQPRDLFKFPSGLSPSLCPANKRLSQSVYANHTTDYALDGVAPNEAASRRGQGAISPRTSPRGKPNYKSGSVEAGANFNGRQPRGLKRHLSNLRYLLVGPSDPISVTSDVVATQGKPEDGPTRDWELTNSKPTTKHFITKNGYSSQENHPTTIGRRVRSKVLKWVKYTKTAVQTRAKKNRGA